MDRTTAILINRSRLTESSLIIHWCAPDCGLIKTVAKGALRPRSPFSGRLDLFVTCDMVFARSAKSDLHTLKEAHLTALRPHLRDSYARVVAAAYFCRLIEMVAEREAPLGELHDLLRLALDHLDAHEPSAKLVGRFECRICQALGLGAVKGDGGKILQEYFHRPLPAQRDELLKQITS